MNTDTHRSVYLDVVKRHEGYRAHAYLDSLGFWTIGYGRMIDERRGGGVSQAEAEMLLTHDVIRAEAVARRLFSEFDRFTLQRRQALVSMAFNLGESGLAGFRRMCEAIQAGDWSRAASEAMDSRWAVQVPSRAAEIAHWLAAED